jgi:hypothetical protein
VTIAALAAVLVMAVLVLAKVELPMIRILFVVPS